MANRENATANFLFMEIIPNGLVKSEHLGFAEALEHY
jgi:hypothetical protein